ncbi:MAG TPA: AbrB/MazE/SpoVT family DNA-binding domain-containing protein [Kofleriaceae bacterium]|nr:AbrB/MazE/SpoVT family DNA-binding domain-containing protein [Kofleriaceae bacterium]
MQKKLSVVGNSLALVIDKPILRMLGIGRDTLVRLTTDGRRLVVEPIEAAASSSPPAAVRLDARKVFQALAHRYDMSQEQFRSLHHEGIRMGAYHGALLTSRALGTAPAEAATMRRLEECLGCLEAGASWADAIAAALIAVPIAGQPS